MIAIEKFLQAERQYRTSLKDCQKNGGRLFKETRSKFGWSQRYLAKLLECDHTYISKIENSRLIPGKPILLKLGKILENEGE